MIYIENLCDSDRFDDEDECVEQIDSVLNVDNLVS